MGRSPCCEKNGLKKGPWTPEEDQKLIGYIQNNGYGNWRTLPKKAGLERCGKSCRLRWTNYLRPDIKRGRFSVEEEDTIIQLHCALGNKWSAIAASLPGRTDNEIKNYWNTHVRKKLLRMGIDPVTHSPRLDLLDVLSIFNGSLYHPSQITISRMLGVHHLVDPELLHPANSVLSSHHENPNTIHHNTLDALFFHPHVQGQLPLLVHDQTLFQELANGTKPSTPCGGFLSEPMETQEQLPNNDAVKGIQNCQQSARGNDSSPYGCFSQASYGYCWPDKYFMDPPPSENSNFQSHNISFAPSFSGFSTPSSTFVNGCSSEDGREGNFCKSLLKLENILDIGEFM